MGDDLDEVGVVQDPAPGEDGMGDLDLVVGEREHQVAGRVRLVGEALGELLAHRHLDVVDELAEDVRHERALGVGQDVVAAEEEVAHHGGQLRAAGDGLLARELEEGVDLGAGAVARLPRLGRPTLAGARVARKFGQA